MQRMDARLLGLAAVTAATLLVMACDDSGGGGGTTAQQPTDENKVQAQVTHGDGSSAPVEGQAQQGQQGVFGGSVAGQTLSLYITSQSGQFITVTIDTAATPLPASVPMGVPTQASAWTNLTSPTGAWSSFDGSGTVSIDQCPSTTGDAFVGRFDGVKLKSELDGSVVTLDGSFNLMLYAVAGALECKPEPTTPNPTDPPDGGSCEQDSCDGPCCPFMGCVTQCQMNCAFGACMQPDPQACTNCAWGCWDSCDISPACESAIGALEACARDNGCDPNADDEDTCVEDHCCAELKAAL